MKLSFGYDSIGIMPKKLSYAEVSRRFKLRGFSLVTPYYEGDTQKLEYICICGKTALLSLNRLGSGDNGCKDCAKKKGKATCMAKYGVDHPRKCKEVVEAAKATCVKKYGVDNPSKAPTVIQKIKDTHMERYGVTSPMHVPEFVEKQKSTIMDRYGVDNPMKNKDVRAKASNTCMEKYGVDNPMKVKEFYDKANNSFQKKDYTMPSGKIVQLQGYEPQALDLLLEKYTEDQIVTEKKLIPIISYEYEEKECKFYPDFYIPHKNKIIEIKSIYTFSAFESKNNAKILATAKQGYNVEYWIIDKHSNLDQIIWVE